MNPLAGTALGAIAGTASGIVDGPFEYPTWMSSNRTNSPASA